MTEHSEHSEVSDISHFDITSCVTLTEKITYGGHSDIWQGLMDKEGCKILVAIKQLRVRHRSGSLSHDERLRMHFNREVHAWSRLSHPNIVPFLGYIVTVDSVPSLVSPWYSNGNAVDYLRLNPEKPRLPLLLQVAEGLNYLHSLPLVHGDIKGDNVLVDSAGCASLCDFGLSRFLDSAVHITGFTTTAFGGTSRFLSLELLDGQPKTAMSDVWAFACTAIQILADQVPYQSTKDYAVQTAITRGEPPLPLDYSSPISSEANLWSIFRMCWHQDPISRPSISEIIGHIQELLPGICQTPIVPEDAGSSQAISNESRKQKSNGAERAEAMIINAEEVPEALSIIDSLPSIHPSKGDENSADQQQLELSQVWQSIKTHPRFEKCDIDRLCDELATQVHKNGDKAVINAEHVPEVWSLLDSMPSTHPSRGDEKFEDQQQPRLCQAWQRIEVHPEFEECYMDKLCAELVAKAHSNYRSTVINAEQIPEACSLFDSVPSTHPLKGDERSEDQIRSELNQVWQMVRAHPQFEECDMDLLCAEIVAKVRGNGDKSGPKPVTSAKELPEILPLGVLFM